MVLKSQYLTEPNNTTTGYTEENIEGLFFTSRRNELYQDDDQNYSDISGLSASATSLIDPDNIAKLLAERDMHVDTIKTTQNKEKYKGELIKFFRRYKASFARFFNVHCLNEAKIFISHLPKEKYISLNCILENSDKQYPVDFSRINSILQNPSYNISIDSIINLAIKLNVGCIRAKYIGERTQAAHYGDCGGSTGDWLFTCREQRAWASYYVDLMYELPQVEFFIPLISLKFVNQEPTHQYVSHFDGHGHIRQYADSVRARVNAVNNMPLGDFLQSFWTNSILVDGSITIHPIQANILSKIIDEVVKYALTHSTPECQKFRKELLENRTEFYSSKLDKIDAQYKLILAYAELAGIDPEDLSKITNPLIREEFNKDIIMLSLIESSADASESLFEKCRKMVDLLREQIDNLLFKLDPELNDSSDEEPSTKLSKLNDHRPLQRI